MLPISGPSWSYPSSGLLMFSRRHARSYRSRLEALVTLALPVRPLLDNSIGDFQGRSNMCCSHHGFLHPSKVTGHANRSITPIILTLILIIYIFYTQTPHQTLIRPERGRLLARSAHAPY